MSDGAIIRGAARAHADGEPLTDLQVRVIAAAWHGGQTHPLYALTSSGAIVAGVVEEVESFIDSRTATGDRAALEGLLAYVEANGERGPQRGWDRLSW